MQLKQQLNAYFPDAVVYKEGQSLECLRDDDKHTVVIDFGLSQEFMRPLRTYKHLDPDPLTGCRSFFKGHVIPGQRAL